MKQGKESAFIDALNSKFAGRSQLTPEQKKIIECWSLIKDQQIFKTLVLIDSLAVSHDPLLEAQKYLILGITLNYKHEFKIAIPLIKKSYEVLRDYPIPRQHRFAIDLLLVSYLNFKDSKGIRFCLDEMKKISSDQSKEERLAHLLENVFVMVPEEILFEYVFEKKLKGEHDLAKLKKFVHRYASGNESEVAHHKGCFQLVSGSLKQVA